MSIKHSTVVSSGDTISSTIWNEDHAINYYWNLYNRQTVSDTTSVEWSSLSAHDWWKIIFFFRTNSSWEYWYLKLNADSGNNYIYRYIYTTSIYSDVGDNKILIGLSEYPYGIAGEIRIGGKFDISNKHPVTGLISAGNSTGSAQLLIAGTWNASANVNTIEIYDNAIYFAGKANLYYMDF